MRAQIKAADRSGAAFAVIVGTNELDDGVVIVRPLRTQAEQVAVRRDLLVSDLQQRVQEANS